MLRKTMIALFTVASIGMLAPSVASARGGGGSFGAGGGFHGGGFGGGGFRGGGFGGGGFHSAAIGGGGFRGGGFRSAAIASGGFRSRAFAADGFRHGRRFAFGAFDDYYSDYGYPYYDYGYDDDAYMAMAAATRCSGAYIHGMAGVSDLSRCAADPVLLVFAGARPGRRMASP